MSGYNHFPGCGCGWCLKNGATGYGQTTQVHYRSEPRAKAFFHHDSFVNPNARCPVCNNCVYFYQSPYGGRVFFDELGPPWPRHGCTDSGREPRIIKSRGTQAPVPLWSTLGWRPAQVMRSRLNQQWYVTFFKDINEGEWVEVLSTTPIILPQEFVAALKEWDEHGFSALSLQDLRSGISPNTIPVFKPSMYAQHSALQTAAYRQKVERSILQSHA